MTTIYRVANDAGAPPVGVVLADDGVAVNLSAATITCRLLNNTDATDVIAITGLTGNTVGAVTTPLVAANLIAGTYLMEWEVVGGATYPARASARPVLIVRPEVS